MQRNNRSHFPCRRNHSRCNRRVDDVEQLGASCSTSSTTRYDTFYMARCVSMIKMYSDYFHVSVSSLSPFIGNKDDYMKEMGESARANSGCRPGDLTAVVRVANPGNRQRNEDRQSAG